MKRHEERFAAEEAAFAHHQRHRAARDVGIEVADDNFPVRIRSQGRPLQEEFSKPARAAKSRRGFFVFFGSELRGRRPEPVVPSHCPPRACGLWHLCVSNSGLMPARADRSLGEDLPAPARRPYNRP